MPAQATQPRSALVASGREGALRVNGKQERSGADDVLGFDAERDLGAIFRDRPANTVLFKSLAGLTDDSPCWPVLAAVRVTPILRCGARGAPSVRDKGRAHPPEAADNTKLLSA